MNPYNVLQSIPESIANTKKAAASIKHSSEWSSKGLTALADPRVQLVCLMQRV
jgi:hypothetical protein